jgi:BASS family bile acid:Na+ symporter
VKDKQSEATYGVGGRWYVQRNWAVFAEWMKNDKIEWTATSSESISSSDPGRSAMTGELLPAFAAVTIFAAMLHLGIAVDGAEYRAAWRSPWLMLKALFASLIAVPLVVIMTARLFALPREAEIGLVLMSICPSAPLAVWRALGAGADRSFAATLQVTAALLATVTIPLTVFLLDEVYAGRAAVETWKIAQLVFLGQMLPLAIGLAARSAWRDKATALEPALARLAKLLLLGLLAVVLWEVWRPVWSAGPRVAVAVCVAALCAAAIGHLLGGPRHSTRTGLAIGCCARNVGLALFVASANHASEGVIAVVFAYAIVAALAITPYILWRARTRPPEPQRPMRAS